MMQEIQKKIIAVKKICEKENINFNCVISSSTEEGEDKTSIYSVGETFKLLGLLEISKHDLINNAGFKKT